MEIYVFAFYLCLISTSVHHLVAQYRTIDGCIILNKYGG